MNTGQVVSPDPEVTGRKGFNKRFGDILERLNAGEIFRRRAARELGIGYAPLKRLLHARAKEGTA